VAAEATGRDEEFDCPVRWEAAVEDRDELIGLGKSVSIQNRLDLLGDDLTGLQELITYGIKGLSAYAVHAQKLGQQDPEIYAFIHRAFDYLTGKPESAEALLALAMECGRINLRTMEILDAANTGAYGHPEPTRVRVTPVKGKCIVVSGHDLKDLEELLNQTEGLGLNVYTHGEMLPANAYPGLKKYKHLVGNYGGAWQDQQKEFEQFPGAILMTTNCLQKPKNSYQDRIFTSGVVGWEGVRHITGHNFAPVIEAALALSKAFGCSVNELPLSFILSWFEQKAVAILLTLLYLGVEKIKLGPSLPAFTTPAVLNVLVDKFKIGPISSVEADLAEALGK